MAINEMKYRWLILIVILSTLSCETKSPFENKFQVAYQGALKNMMHKGDLSAQAKLADFKDKEHLYAIGALENLKGEIQIFDGKAFNTMVSDTVLSYDQSFDKKAALLVYASVSRWKTINLPEEIMSYQQLENYLPQVAKENQINTNQPFPFLIEGTAPSFDWHVINWKEGDTEHSHEKHIRSGLYGTIQNRAVQFLGFYSDSHHAIFTHHTTNMHIHVKTLDNKIAGHADDLTLGKGMILKLPDNEVISK
ncbi:MAG: acetolactate decarboxylase [Saprospiraceae bacterium]